MADKHTPPDFSAHDLYAVLYSPDGRKLVVCRSAHPALQWLSADGKSAMTPAEAREIAEVLKPLLAEQGINLVARN